jgi:LmbE family N-acetylglucosaminyl deacetylase
MQPPSPSLSAQTRLLVVAPHPDDETLGCGLLIQQVLAAGGAVHLLLLTDGDNNPWPQRYIERRLHIGDSDRRRWGARRRSEAMHAIANLGLSADALEPLGWLDMDVTRRLRDDTPASIAAIRSTISSFNPTLVCFPALEDSHPDHGAAHVLCRLALVGVNPAPVQWAYPVHGGGDLSEYAIRIDPTPQPQQRKLQALAEHRSQMVLSGGRMRRLALSPERYMRADTAGNARLPWRPPVILHRWLRLLVATPNGVQDWSWQDAPISRIEDGSYRLEWPSSQPSPQPGFVKLHLDWPSPWIFDHWGWHAL